MTERLRKLALEALESYATTLLALAAIWAVSLGFYQVAVWLWSQL